LTFALRRSQIDDQHPEGVAPEDAGREIVYDDAEHAARRKTAA
jgi:hypothetical protein